MIRSFIAIPLPPEVLDELESAVRGLEELELRGRAVRREAMHLTLKFLGDVSEDRLRAVALTLHELAKRIPPFDVSLNGPDAFSHRKGSRVVFVSVQRSPTLIRLQGGLEDALTALDLEREGREYRGHLTLMRLKSRRHLSRLQDWFTRELQVTGMSFRVNHFNLYQSALKSSGAVHSILESFPLLGSGP